MCGGCLTKIIFRAQDDGFEIEIVKKEKIRTWVRRSHRGRSTAVRQVHDCPWFASGSP